VPLDQALRRYRQGRFTDQDVTRCTGLSPRAWRELLRIGAVRTLSEDRGRGVIRLCDATVLKRAAVISVLSRAGWNLEVSGQIAYFLPFHTLLYSVCDPVVILQRTAYVDPKTEFPPRVEQPKVDWFDPDKPCETEAGDWLLEIYEGRFVGVSYQAKAAPTIFGDLRKDGASFVAWFPFYRKPHLLGSPIEQLARELLTYRFIDFVADWGNPTKWRREFKLINYRYEKHDEAHDPICMAADAAVHSPLFKTTINLSLTIRKALRRYLGIEREENIDHGN
jgi:hypothetical protein